MLTHAPGHPTGGNRITQTVLGAHDGGVFGLCALRDGTLVSGGGRDRRVVLWGSDYSKLQEVEVRKGRGSYEGEETSLHLTRAPNARSSSPACHSQPHPYVCCTLTSPPFLLLPAQVPEDFGPVRTVAEGRGDTLYVGTTRNSIVQGSVHTGFSLLVQVSSLFCACPSDSPTISLPCSIHPSSLPHPFSSGLANTTGLPFTCSCFVTPLLT